MIKKSLRLIIVVVTSVVLAGLIMWAFDLPVRMAY
jgi:hypothetical protein